MLSLLDLIVHIDVLGLKCSVVCIVEKLVHVIFRQQFPVYNCLLLLLYQLLFLAIFCFLFLNKSLFLEEIGAVFDFMLSLTGLSIVAITINGLFSGAQRRVCSFLGLAQFHFSFDDLDVVLLASLEALFLHELVQNRVLWVKNGVHFPSESRFDLLELVVQVVSMLQRFIISLNKFHEIVIIHTELGLLHLRVLVDLGGAEPLSIFIDKA